MCSVVARENIVKADNFNENITIIKFFFFSFRQDYYVYFGAITKWLIERRRCKHSKTRTEALAPSIELGN